MKKIAIATITSAKTGNFNYGNILQNYALSTYLKNKGFDVETLYYQSFVPEFTKNMTRAKDNERTIAQSIDDAKRILTRSIQKQELNRRRESRKQKFIRFIDANIKYSNNTYNAMSDFSQLNDLYDGFIVGSDQVWNPYYEGSNEFFYLGFADREKRICYAPSIGVDHIPDEMKGQVGSWLSNFDSLSMREKNGQTLVKKLYGLDSVLVCDPVFLLGLDDWNALNLEKYENENYFLVYILGKKSPKTKKQIRCLEKNYHIKSMDVFSNDDPHSEFMGPEEFLAAIKNAKFVVTDSFHGTAFSMIFGKPLAIVDRNAANQKSTYKMNGRIDNIIRLADMSNREIDFLITNPSSLYEKHEIEGTSLQKLICKSKKYLDDCLENL